MNITIQLPAIFAINERSNKNSIQQLIEPKVLLEVVAEHYQKNRVKGHVLTSTNGSKEQILAIYNQAKPPEEFNKVLRVKPCDLVENDNELVDLSSRKWIKHPKLIEVLEVPINYKERLKEVLDSWQDAFSYKLEDEKQKIKGLRPPQEGAVHGAHAHWAVTDEPATIVMPTGIGKTETMLSILISKQCEKLLVVVPTDALRTQIADKFLTLGILKEFEIVSNTGLYPIVGVLNHKPKNCDDVDTFFGKCHVIVTTMSIAGQCPVEVQEQMAHQCPFLFIDEAHHIGAKTWESFKEKFNGKKVLQFTATPFRNDDKPVDGKIIFDYPLKKAQEEGYFKPINFEPVRVYNPKMVDQVIAENAVKQLCEDRKKYDHIMMARVESIERAEEIYSIYAKKYPEFNPVQIHTGINSITEREQIRQDILSGESKIIVCVDMLGEGFDLPQLKIAAFHDIRKSLAVTLQLAGRFTRSRQDLGEATFIANIADLRVREELKKLYYQDANWDDLLKETSENIIQGKINLQELIAGFQNTLTDISLLNLRPAMSTIIYRTKCKNWNPENFEKGLHGLDSFDRIESDLNVQKNTLVIVTAKKIPIDWAQSKDIFNWNWELYVIFWDKDQDLLFIHNSNNNGYYEKLAESIVGKVELIKGGDIFRCFSGINRLRLQNVGLIEQFGRLIRYIMRAGQDIDAGLTQAQRQQAVKSNVFGMGYDESGNRTTIGCSYKGRIWSRHKTDLNDLREWCSNIGRKVLDKTIDADEVLKGTLISKTISQPPQKMPICIEWPEMIYNEPENIFTFVVGEQEFPLFQTDIELIKPTEIGDLKFTILSDETTIDGALIFSDNDYNFSITGNTNVLVKQRGEPEPLSNFFYQHPPIIWFADGSFLVGNLYSELNKVFIPYNRGLIKTWNWEGINIRKESQGITKEPDTIQYRTIRELERENYDIIFDDDGPGEAADVVCILTRENTIMVEFYHCKFSREATPGARISDLYTVCGQAQKSIHWVDNPTKLFDHLLRREPRRTNGLEVSRFEKGSRNELEEIQQMSLTFPRVELKIFIVQPGLSKSAASRDQLELLSVTENHFETRKLPFEVIASD